MIKKVSLLGLCAFIFMAFAMNEKIEKKAVKVMVKHFETKNISMEPLLISEAANLETPSEFGKKNFFKIVSNDTFLGYGYIGNAPSKTATFDYLVLFDNDFIVTKSKVLIYREEYGGEIGSKRWLKQFLGTSSETPELVYQKDIIPISGATISVRSMTQAMNDLLKSIGVLQKQNLL